jgi:predicted hotdog family 3-hydroxylacyl-ACP dehydratase
MPMPDLPKSDWAHLIPHAGSMCLLDAVRRFDDSTIHAVSSTHLHANHPLRGAHGLHAVHLAEYGAQATAVHGALLARSRGIEAVKPGRLVSLREFVLNVETLDQLSGALDITAQCLYADESGAQYSFSIEHAGALLASGRVAVIHPQP